MNYSPVMIFGEVLFDCFPDGNQVLGGAPFNVAWHLQAFGLAPLFISRIGKDSYGERIKQSMQDWGMSLEGLQEDLEHPTGLVTVQFEGNEPHYYIVENSAYDFIQAGELPAFHQSPLLYHGTLSLRHQISLTTLQQIRQEFSPPLFLDVNLRSPYWRPETVEPLLRKAHWLKLNEAELALLVPQTNTMSKRVEFLFFAYGFEGVIVTGGKAGASAFTASGEMYSIQPSQAIAVKDTVGAGDAFCSVLILGLVRGWEWPIILERGQDFASAIVGIQGATTQDRSFYNGFLRAWN